MISKDLDVKKNTFLGLFAIVIWSFSAFLTVELTTVPLFELLACEFLIGFLIVVTRFLFTKERSTFLHFQKKDLIIASLALIANQLFYCAAFRNAPAAQVDLINYLWPTLLILLTSLLPNEKLCPSYLLACGLCLFGVYTLLSPEGAAELGSENTLGYLLAFGAAMSWALYSLYSRYKGSSNSANCIAWACGPTALVSFLLHLYFEKFVYPTLYELALIITLGAFQMGLAYYFWERGMKKGCVKFLSLSSYSIPIFSILLLVIFGKTEFEPRMITATIIISLSPIFPILAKKIQSSPISTTKKKKNTPILHLLKST